MRYAALLILLLAAACSDRPADTPPSTSSKPADSTDSAFASLQARGKVAMGVDQYTSVHHFESLADGGRIRLERDRSDPAGAGQIRRHLQSIAVAFAQGNFALPGMVHDREVPGTKVMAERRSRIRYAVDTLPQGGELRIQSKDSIAIAAIHEFLAFQRRDHRSGGTEGAP
jgi:hypothetical protein